MTSHMCQRVNTGESYIFGYIYMLWALNTCKIMHLEVDLDPISLSEFEVNM